MHGEIFEDPLFEDPLHKSLLDRDCRLYPDLKGGRKGEQGRKGVYRAKTFQVRLLFRKRGEVLRGTQSLI